MCECDDGDGPEVQASVVRKAAKDHQCYECWVCEVWQSAYGHPARKRTWLLYCGTVPPLEAKWERPKGTHQIGWFERGDDAGRRPAAVKTAVPRR